MYVLSLSAIGAVSTSLGVCEHLANLVKVEDIVISYNAAVVVAEVSRIDWDPISCPRMRLPLAYYAPRLAGQIGVEHLRRASPSFCCRSIKWGYLRLKWQKCVFSGRKRRKFLLEPGYTICRIEKARGERH